MEPPEGNSKAVACLVHTALTLTGDAQGICSAIPTADKHWEHTNTSSSETLSWAGQGQTLKHLVVRGCFSNVLTHCIPLYRQVELEHQSEQPVHVLSIPQGCKHLLYWRLGLLEKPCVRRDHWPWPDAPQALWILHTSSKPFLLLSWHFYKVPCYLISAYPCCSLNQSSPICSGPPDQLLPSQLTPFLQILTTSYKYGCEVAKCQFSLERWFI